MVVCKYGMSVAPLDAELLQVLCNRDPRRYQLEWACVWLDGGRELWTVRKYPGPCGAAGGLYRVIAPPFRHSDLPRDWVGKVQCDCPEAQAGAPRLGGICKHALMVYAWQGAWHGTGARWLYLDVYLRKFCSGADTHMQEVHHG